MPLLARELVYIGETAGVDAAKRVYEALKDEPVDLHGDRVDWSVIERDIYRALDERAHGGG